MTHVRPVFPLSSAGDPGVIDMALLGVIRRYPGRKTLTTWVRQALPEAKKTVVGRLGRPSYPEALKQAGVIGLCSRQKSAQALADKLCVCTPTLYNWKNQLLGPEAPASMKRNKTSPPATGLAELERQLESLQRDIRHLQLERDLLKKANEIIKKTRASICNS